MENFNEWWQALALPLKIYWIIAVIFTVFFLIQLALSFLGGDDLDVPDDTPDADIAADGGMPFQFFTLKNLIGFFTIFGWVGIAATDSGFPPFISVMLSIVGGLFMMALMASVAYFLSKATADGTMKISRAIGQTGECYLTIPKNRMNTGKVQVIVQGSLRTLEAMTNDETDIPNGKLIKVRQVLGDNVLLVTAE